MATLSIITPEIIKAPFFPENPPFNKPGLSHLEDFSKLTDSELYQRCKEYGAHTRHWMRKFAALLPEVERRQLYKKRGHASIYEFAAKLASMNQSTVDKILYLSRRLKDKPKLQEKFQSGEIGWSKLEKVSFIATRETDTFWAEKAESLPQLALTAYIQEIRKTSISQNKTPDSILKSDQSHGFPISQKRETFPRISFVVPIETESKFRLIKQKLEKAKRQTLTFGEVLEELMRAFEKSNN